MSQCGVSIPLDEIAEAIINAYADDFAIEVIKRMNLSQFINRDNGVANNLTLRESLIVDEHVKGDLCSILQGCIANKIQEELGCERDNHVSEFYIDKENDRIVIVLKFGEKFAVSRKDLESWLQLADGGIKSGVLVTQDTIPKQVIKIKNKDDSVVDIDVSALQDIKIERGEIIDNEIIRLYRSDGVTIDINASTLVPNSPYIVSGVFVSRDNGYWLDFTRNDKTEVSVDMTDIITNMISTVVNRVINTGYRLNTQVDDYSLVGDDFNGLTIIRADKTDNQTITITKPPSEDFIGKAIIIRKTNGGIGTLLSVVAGVGVILNPDDITPLRRIGSSATLVYIGDGKYDVFGELP